LNTHILALFYIESLRFSEVCACSSVCFSRWPAFPVSLPVLSVSLSLRSARPVCLHVLSFLSVMPIRWALSVLLVCLSVDLSTLSVCLSYRLSVLSSACVGGQLVLSAYLTCRSACPVGLPVLSFCLSCRSACPVGLPVLSLRLSCLFFFVRYKGTTLCVPYVCREILLICGLRTGKIVKILCIAHLPM
jgi:hypothetical protein